jgi:hypothetical protein
MICTRYTRTVRESGGTPVLLCRKHHRRLHTTGYHAKLLPDATFEVTYPDGHTESTVAPGPIAQQCRRRFGGS